jgi:hypothetical protein
MVTTIREAARRRRRGAQQHRARTQQVVVALAAGVGGPSRRARYSNAEKPCRRFGERLDWNEYIAGFASDEFKRAYRMDLATFNQLLGSIESSLERDAERAARSSSGSIAPVILLSMTLRWLAGGSLHDIYRAHRVSMEAFYESQWLVIDAINNHPDYALKFPVDDPEKLSHTEAGFRAKSTGQLHTGCVGAIDGVFIKIRSVAFGSVTFATLGKPATKALMDVSSFNAGDPTIPTRTSTQGASGAAGSTRTA